MKRLVEKGGPRGERGFVLVAVAVALALVGALAFLMTREGALEGELARATARTDQARYVAEAGLGHARWTADQSACVGYDLPDTPFGPHTYRATFTPPSGSPVTIAATATLADGSQHTLSRREVPIYESSSIQTLQPGPGEIADTYVYQWKPTWNYGAANRSWVEAIWIDSRARTLIRFDLGSIPSGARVRSAILSLYQGAPSATGGSVGVLRVTSDWAEGSKSGAAGTGATWNERSPGVPWTTPGGDLGATVYSKTSLPAGTLGWFQWDVTELVGGWVSGTFPNRGLALVSQTWGTGAYFVTSDDTDPALHPRLAVSYACECGEAPVHTFTLQPRASTGKDAWITGSKPAWNFGAHDNLPVVESALQRGLLEFDLSGLPAGAIVQAAQLELYASMVQKAGTVDVHRVEDAWVEGTCQGSGCTADGVTWDTRDGVAPWSTPGVDHEASPAASQTVDVADAWHSFDLTSLAADWVRGALPNHGLLLKGTSGGANVDFESSDHADASLHPRLTVTYSCPCGDCGDATFCDADYAPDLEVGQFATSSFGSNSSRGIAFLPDGLTFGGVAVSDGGSWLLVDSSSDLFYLTDLDGNLLTTLPTPTPSAQGVSLVRSGPWADHLVITDDASNQIAYVDLEGNLVHSFPTAGFGGGVPAGVAFVGKTESGGYDGHLAVGDRDAESVHLIDQSGVLQATLDVDEGTAANLRYVAHLPGSDKLLAGYTAEVRIFDVGGTLLRQYGTGGFGLGNLEAVTVNPLVCDHVLVDKGSKSVTSLNRTDPWGERLVNTTTANEQSGPALAASSAGDVVVAWQSFGQEGNNFGVYARRFAASGAPQSGEWRVNTTTARDQMLPAVARDDAGNFVIAWQSFGQDRPNTWGIEAQRYDASGAPQGAEFQVNTTTTNDQASPSVAMGAAGAFVVTWSGNGPGDAAGIFGQRYNASGGAQGSEFRVNNTTVDVQDAPSVAMDDAGNFVVVWQSLAQDGDQEGIYAQRFDAGGTPQGAELRVNTTVASRQQNPSVAMDETGSFVVAWQSLAQDGDGYGIYAQRYDAAGVAQGGELLVNTTTAGSQLDPVVSMDAAGNFLVAWQSSVGDGDGYGVYARRFDAAGAPQGDEFQVNVTTAGTQDGAAAALMGGGEAWVAWDGNGAGDDSGVFTRRFPAP